MRFADPCVADPYIHDLVEEPDGSVTGTTPTGVYTAAHIRLHREDLKRWRRLRAQAVSDMPVFSALVGSLEQLSSLARNAEREELEARTYALRQYVSETKRRFGID